MSYRWIARVTNRFGPSIVLFAGAMTVLTVFPLLSGLGISTSFDRFLTDDPVVAADHRAAALFGHESRNLVVLVEAINPGGDVLAPDALREQYGLVLAARAIPGVTGTVSIAEVVDLLVRYDRAPAGWPACTPYEDPRYTLVATKEGQISANDPRILSRRDLLIDLVNGTLDPAAYGMSDCALPDVQETGSLLRTLFTKDFGPDDHRPLGALMIVRIEGSLDPGTQKEVSAAVRQTLRARELYDVKVSMTSQELIALDVDASTNQSLRLLAGLSFGLVAVNLFLAFRKPSYVLVPMLVVVLASVWTLGTLRLLGIPLSALMVATIPLILGMGIDDSVHLSNRYLEEREKGRPVAGAMRIAVRQTGRAITLTSVTTVIAFLSNLFTSVIPVREFGLAVAIGLSYAWVLSLFFHPAARTIIDRYMERRGAPPRRPAPSPAPTKGSLPAGGWGHRFSTLFTHLAVRRGTTILVLVVLLGAGAGVSGTKVRSEFSLEEFLPAEWDSVNSLETLRERYWQGATPSSIVLVEASGGTDLAAVGAYAGLHDLVRRMGDDRHIVLAPVGDSTRIVGDNILDLVRVWIANDSTRAATYGMTVQGAPAPGVTDDHVRQLFDRMLADPRPVTPLSPESFAQRGRALLHRDGESGRYDATLVRVSVRSATSEEDRALQRELEADIRGVAWPAGVHAIATGGMILTVSTLDAITLNMVSSAVIASIAAAIILALLYGRGARILGLASVAPVALSALFVIGLMPLIGVSLNVMTVMVASIAIGVGIDYAIHFNERFREEIARGRATPRNAIRTMFLHTGMGQTVAMTTTVAGYLVLVLSPMPIIQQFGFMNAITIAICWLMTMFVYAVLLYRWGASRYPTRRSSAITPRGSPTATVLALPTSADRAPRKSVRFPLQTGGQTIVTPLPSVSTTTPPSPDWVVRRGLEGPLAAPIRQSALISVRATSPPRVAPWATSSPAESRGR